MRVNEDDRGWLVMECSIKWAVLVGVLFCCRTVQDEVTLAEVSASKFAKQARKIIIGE